VTYAVLTLGCRVNQADSLQIEAALRRLGVGSAADDEADSSW